MSFPERRRIEVSQEEIAPRLRIVVKQNGECNGTAKKAVVAGKRLQRVELAALGWELRRQRLGLR